MSNTPKQQAELYRKAAETIEMCAHHGIEPIIKMSGCKFVLDGILFNCDFDRYEFPITVIEGKLVWIGDIVYDSYGRSVKVEAVEYWQGDSEISLKTDGRWYSLSKYTLIPPKQPLCEVEGKPVYKGDKLYFKGTEYVASRHVEAESFYEGYLVVADGGYMKPDYLSWLKQKRTVMVELTVDDAEVIANYWDGSWTHNEIAQRTTIAIRKSLETHNHGTLDGLTGGSERYPIER